MMKFIAFCVLCVIWGEHPVCCFWLILGLVLAKSPTQC
jgi:hypothetical protein